jgi:hypothetical protein
MELHDKIKARADNKAKVHSRQADNYVERKKSRSPKEVKQYTEAIQGPNSK